VVTGRAALDELVRREGWTSAAARIARVPEQLGKLRGEAGWLASAAAKQERAGAERAAGALPDNLTRIAEAEAQVERTNRTSLEAQLAANATGIPRQFRGVHVRMAQDGPSDLQHAAETAEGIPPTLRDHGCPARGA
jgi:hypothetical protein